VVDRLDSLVPRAGATPELDLDEVYRQHGATVSRWVKRLWGHRDAEDVLHEVFLVVQQQLPRFRGEAALTTWLYQITARVVSNRRRKARWRRLLFLRAAPELASTPAAAETPHASAEREQAASMVYAVLDQLSERDRTLLVMFELEGFSIQQVMNVLSLSESNAWVSLHRARARFRKVYVARFGAQKGAS
jgi:RNA polymerase sigma-70 factor (ECF subfamily)